MWQAVSKMKDPRGSSDGPPVSVQTRFKFAAGFSRVAQPHSKDRPQPLYFQKQFPPAASVASGTLFTISPDHFAHISCRKYFAVRVLMAPGLYRVRKLDGEVLLDDMLASHGLLTMRTGKSARSCRGFIGRH